MPTELWTALISVAGSVLGVLVSFPLLTWRITQLEKKVDKHNGVIEKTYNLEKDMEYVKQDITTIKKDVEELKYARKVCKTN